MSVIVALFAVLLGLPPLLILPFILLLKALVVLDHIWLLIFIPEGAHRGRNGGLACHAIETVAVWTLMGVSWIASLHLFSILHIITLLTFRVSSRLVVNLPIIGVIIFSKRSWS